MFSDRKKDLVKLNTGEYISLGKVEGVLKQSPYIDNCCVYAHGERTFPVVLIIPNPKHLKTLAATVGVHIESFEELCQDKKVNKAMLTAIETISKSGMSLYCVSHEVFSLDYNSESFITVNRL